MMYNYSPIWNTGFGPHMFGFGILIAILALWSIFWKGWSLWLAARRGEKAWFIILLILNTVGIVEIIYIFAIAKKSDKKEVAHMTSPKMEESKTTEHSETTSAQ